MELIKHAELERKVSRLLEGYAPLRDDNHKLKKNLEKKELEIKVLKKQFTRLDREKELVKDRVDTLIGMLNELIPGGES